MSETFRPVNSSLDITTSYSDIVLIREGAMSRLYRVSKAGKYLAIKTTKDNSAMQLAMLKREYELSITLNHYHLPHYYTYEENTPVGPGIVMEYIQGRNLSDFLAEKPTIDTRRRVFYQLMEAVAYIHKNGIIHNDLKPDNILITQSNDDVKLLDFGLSNTDAHYLTKNMGGTREYASPELLAQKDDLDARSDIYSIGKLMELIFPYNYRSYSSKCLRENPDDRWDNVDQLIRSWNKSSHPIYLIIIAIMVGIVAVMMFFVKDSPVDNTAQQELLDSLSVARSEVSEAQQRAQRAQQEAADAKNEAQLAQQQFDSIRNVQSLSEAERQQWELTKNEAVNEMKQALDHRYQLALDSIENVPYGDFVFQILGSYVDDAVKIKSKYVSAATDETIASIISATFDNIHSANFNSIDKMAKSRPFISDLHDEIGLDAVKFYHSLLQKYLPYRKYDPSKDAPKKEND